jgi:hypothetical protein
MSSWPPQQSRHGGQNAIFFRHLDVADPEFPSVGIYTHPAEEFLDDVMLLPGQQHERLARKPALRVDEELLEEVHGMLSLVGVVIKRPASLKCLASR